MVNVFFWVAFGAIVGWVISLIQLQQDSSIKHNVAYVIAGAVGGLTGGLGGATLDATAHGYDASVTGIMFAVFGAVALIALAGFASGKHPDTRR